MVPQTYLLLQILFPSSNTTTAFQTFAQSLSVIWRLLWLIFCSTPQHLASVSSLLLSLLSFFLLFLFPPEDKLWWQGKSAPARQARLQRNPTSDELMSFIHVFNASPARLQDSSMQYISYPVISCMYSMLHVAKHVKWIQFILFCSVETSPVCTTDSETTVCHNSELKLGRRTENPHHSSGKQVKSLEQTKFHHLLSMFF